MLTSFLNNTRGGAHSPFGTSSNNHRKSLRDTPARNVKTIKQRVMVKSKQVYRIPLLLINACLNPVGFGKGPFTLKLLQPRRPHLV
jgi:hypothetical protein